MSDETLVTGYCIDLGTSGIPEMRQCSVQKTEHTGFFVRLVEADVVEGVTEGETFFQLSQFAAAARKMRDALKMARLDHMMAIAYLEDQIELTEEVMRLEVEGKLPCP